MTVMDPVHGKNADAANAKEEGIMIVAQVAKASAQVCSQHSRM